MTERLLPKETEWLDALNNVDAKLATLDKEFRPLVEKSALLLKKKLDRLNEIVVQRDLVRAKLEALQELYPDLDVWGAVQDSPQSSPETPSSGDYSNMTVWEAAQAVLIKNNRPMYTREIADEVIAGGKKIAEPKTSKLHTAMKHKRGIFVSRKRGKKSIWSLVAISSEETNRE